MENSRNFVLVLTLSLAVLIGWQWAMDHFYPQPDNVPVTAETVDTPAEAAAAASGEIGESAATSVDLESSLGAAERIRIDSPKVAGSIAVGGAMIDDIVLKDYAASPDGDSEPVRIFAPRGTDVQQYAQFGFLVNGAKISDDVLWESDGDTLSVGNPVTLRHDAGNGVLLEQTYSIDENYMITVEQAVSNRGENGIVAQPFGLVGRTSTTMSDDFFIAHSGPIGSFGQAVEYGYDYSDVEEERKVSPSGTTDWLGFTDIYWLAALVPQAGTDPDATFRSLGGDLYRADMIYDPVRVEAGRKVTTTSRLFAGAKDSEILDAYQDAGIPQFGLAIDWGWFRWFEKPFLWLLKNIFALVGNFGVAIIILTIIVRGLMFPIAQKQFASMAAMKAIQPKMKKLQERHKDDKVKQQQEMQKLFKEEQVNPLAGCLPLILQIPIFFALYKVLYLAIEMRHQNFLWIEDLSAPDPATILNLFGLLPFTPPSFLAIGILAVLLGVTMWLTFKLNPSAMDPVQQQVFSIMPWVLMFIMAPFAAGLLLYWVTSNVLTLAQQKYLYSKHPQLKAAAEKEKAEKAAEAAEAKP
ncbi:membrane protein insertase YidC [Erythrobacter sp. SD-21]|uniref:membrane protein insertase YidC n=1 Tax=Erythrobacter sp. SD-21 TaxID=161528 RepID=UPI000153F4DD|nr:membrane protein insertase YidC [Erythrobacter sp. SD-21]EDL48385.1 putative inner membrane protein translocase component YidC [Erythrobacter sp. SD-21]